MKRVANTMPVIRIAVLEMDFGARGLIRLNPATRALRKFASDWTAPATSSTDYIPDFYLFAAWLGVCTILPHLAPSAYRTRALVSSKVKHGT